MGLLPGSVIDELCGTDSAKYQSLWQDREVGQWAEVGVGRHARLLALVARWGLAHSGVLRIYSATCAEEAHEVSLDCTRL